MDFINQWLAELEIAPFVGAIIIAVATISAAKIVQLLGQRITATAHRWSKAGTRVRLFQIINRPLWITVLLLGILIEVKWINPANHIDFLVTGATSTVLAIIWGITLVRILGFIASGLSHRYPAESELLRMTENIGIAFIGILGGLVVMAVWNINLTPLLASAGIVGIVVGLAAKDTLGNFLGGISLFLDRPFKRGDFIILNSGERGRVHDIGLRSTRIITRDDILITVPNSVIVSTKIINETAPAGIMRVRAKISVLQGSDVENVQEALLKIAKENRLVLSEPAPRVRFRGFGDTSFDFELLCWIAKPKDKGRVLHQLNTAAVKEFNQSGINLVTPQRELFVYRISDVDAVPKEERPHAAGDGDQSDQIEVTPFTSDMKKQTEQGNEGTGVAAP
jgi:MscS family membrane protein